jgi:VIT1/CCC1 family predicted Fe2+/Mn2+ transporter
MIQEEYGLHVRERSPLRAGAVTFWAFVFLGAVPLLAFLPDFFAPGSGFRPYLPSTILTGFSLFLVGAIKARFLDTRWYRSGAEALAIGGAAAAVAYFAGALLASFSPS